jgi:MFS family permease
MAPFVGPSVGPLLGGFINSFANWRWTHWLLLIWSGCYYIGLILLVPETYRMLLGPWGAAGPIQVIKGRS